ncbi:MAG: class I SAM-dependent methyltransferase [Pseudomonadota bacterium]
MSQADREKWNQRYREGAYAEREHPAAFLVEHMPGILAQQLKAKTSNEPLRALDIACGAGRNAFYLAGLGYQVDAIDVSAEALNRARATSSDHHASIRWVEHDLDEGLPADLPLADLIVVIRYLDLNMVRVAAQQLRPGGYLLCEVHLATEEVVAGPSGSAFRVAPSALRDAAAAAGLEIVSYWEGVTRDPDQAVVAVARLVGRKRFQ